MHDDRNNRKRSFLSLTKDECCQEISFFFFFFFFFSLCDLATLRKIITVVRGGVEVK